MTSQSPEPTEASRVEDLVTTLIAPLVAKDGGIARFVSIEGDTATIALEGACIGCPVRPITRDRVIAPLLSKELGRAIAVELV